MKRQRQHDGHMPERRALRLWRACRATQAASTAQAGRLRAQRMRASGLERGCQLQEDVGHGLVGAVGDGRPPRASEVLLGALLRAARPTRPSFLHGAYASKAVDPAAHCARRMAGGRHPKELLRRLEGDADLLRKHPAGGSAAARRHWRRLHAMHGPVCSLQAQTCMPYFKECFFSGILTRQMRLGYQATNHGRGPGPHLSESLKSSLRPAASPTKKLADRSAPGREVAAVRPGTRLQVLLICK